MRELFDRVRNLYGYATAYNSDPNLKHLQALRDHNLAEFDRMIAHVEAAAEQRGAEKAFRKTQEIIAGFEHTIDEARERDDMINTGYLIQEIDTEIQDLQEDDDD